MSQRPVPVPDTCEWLYAVMTPEPLDHEDHVPLPSPALLRAHGTSQVGLARLDRCSHQLVLQSQAPTAAAAAAARDTRIQALELAARHDGVVLELLTPRLVELTSDQVSLAHATQWYVLDHGAVLDGVLLTEGLAQFGLPEVRLRTGLGGGAATGATDGTPADDPALRGMASAVLAGLVHRLIEEWPEHDPVGEATVTLRDIAFGLGDPQADVTPHDRGVRLRIDYVPDDHVLAVELLDDPATTLFA
jgi:hypothetical protein